MNTERIKDKFFAKLSADMQEQILGGELCIDVDEELELCSIHPVVPMSYRERIKRILPNFDPRHIEAFMRSNVEGGTLDHLSPSAFCAEAQCAARCVDEGGRILAERVARSYGM